MKWGKSAIFPHFFRNVSGIGTILRKNPEYRKTKKHLHFIRNFRFTDCQHVAMKFPNDVPTSVLSLHFSHRLYGN